MTAKEYLRQAYRLDQRIGSDLREAARLRELAASVSPQGIGEGGSPNRPTEAPFARGLERVWEMEQRIGEEVERLLSLKEQIRAVIDAVPDADERMVLTYRYIHNMTWEEIGDKLYADRTTVYRWHGRALEHVSLPEDPITI